jgi:hypothetical protein
MLRFLLFYQSIKNQSKQKVKKKKKRERVAISLLGKIWFRIFAIELPTTNRLDLTSI